MAAAKQEFLAQIHQEYMCSVQIGKYVHKVQ